MLFQHAARACFVASLLAVTAGCATTASTDSASPEAASDELRGGGYLCYDGATHQVTDYDCCFPPGGGGK